MISTSKTPLGREATEGRRIRNHMYGIPVMNIFFENQVIIIFVENLVIIIFFENPVVIIFSNRWVKWFTHRISAMGRSNFKVDTMSVAVIL